MESRRAQAFSITPVDVSRSAVTRPQFPPAHARSRSLRGLNRPETSGHRPAATDQRPQTSGQRRVARDEWPETSGQRPGAGRVWSCVVSGPVSPRVLSPPAASRPRSPVTDLVAFGRPTRAHRKCDRCGCVARSQRLSAPAASAAADAAGSMRSSQCGLPRLRDLPRG